MKTPYPLLLACAALLLATLPTDSLAASASVSIPLTTGTIRSGSTYTVTSGTAAIIPSEVYYYSISGSCAGVGTYLGQVVPDGTSLVSALGLVDSNIVQYLSGFVLNPSGKLPFVCVNKLAKGSFTFGPLTVKGAIRVKAGISKPGVCSGSFSNISFSVGPGVDKNDGLVIEGGELLVSTTEITGTAPAPNLSFVDSIGHLDGIGLTGTDAEGHSEAVTLGKGKTASFVVVLQNTGSTAGSFVLQSAPVADGFTDKFIYKTKNETAAVTGTSGFTTPSLAAGAATTVTWQLTNKSATSGAVSPVLTAVPTVSGTISDALVITGTTD